MVKTTTINFGEEINKGGFGSILECSYSTENSDSKNQKVAKKIYLDEGKVTNLIEPFIMSSVDSHYIQPTKGIYCSQSNMYIIQDRAVSDLSRYVFSNEWEERNVNKTLNLFYKICCGISVLDKLGIIHGDIKLGNYLYYNTNNIKLTDFSLSCFKAYINRYHFSTCTYRAPEIWLREELDEKLDIWSLGCVLYQLYFKRTLFHFQGKGKDNYYKYTNSLYDFFEITGQKHSIKFFKNIDYIETKLSNKWDKDGIIEKLIMRMLRFRSYKRISIDDIMNLNIFENKIKPKYSLLESSKPINFEFSTKFDFYNNKLLDKFVYNIALNIFSRLKGLNYKYDTEILVKQSICIAVKLIESKDPRKINEYLISIPKIENTICNYLKYKFLSLDCLI